MPIERSTADLARRLAAILSLLVIVAGPARDLVRGRLSPDFGQYYMGGAIVVEGAADAMYPIPVEGAAGNAGWRDNSTMRPAYAAIAEERGVGNVNRFFQPPPAAVAFAPLAFLPYEIAHWVWKALMCLCCWHVALLAGRWHRHLSGRPTIASAAVTFLVAASPLTYRTVRTGQISPLVAIALAEATWSMGRAPLRHAGAVMVAGALKYIGIVFPPVAVALRDWRSLAALVGGTAVVVGATVALVGIEPFRVFFTDILPTLGRTSSAAGNQSLLGFAARLTGDQVPAAIVVASRLVVVAGLVAVAIAAHVKRASLDRGPTRIAIGVAAILVMLIGSPICWEHYFLYLAPFAGWIVWEASRRGWIWRIVIAASLASWWFPLAVVGGGPSWLREPFRSHMLWAAVAVLVLAGDRLRRGAASAA